jgi:uncharacterized protein YjhX (UPF0386 family)
LENDVKSRRGKRKIHTLEMGGHVQMARNDPEAQKEVLVIGLHMVGKLSMDLLILKP